MFDEYLFKFRDVFLFTDAYQKFKQIVLNAPLFLLNPMGADIQTGTFSIKLMKEATDDFAYNNKIGEGGFGPVYKVF